MKDVVLDLHAAIDERAATVEYGPLPWVKGDASQIGQVLRNLVGNALKFVKDRPPHVQVAATRDRGNWVFEVRDNGIGIEEQDLDKVFLLFKRLHAVEDYPGTGLGLAITRRIVERHGGRIWATSTPNEGSRFFFTLPALD
jgi:signal transduction histidine kinase